VVVVGFGAEGAECEVVDEDADGDYHYDENHSFVAYRLDEAVEDLCKCMSTDLSSTDTVWVSVHAVLPVVARNLECW